MKKKTQRFYRILWDKMQMNCFSAKLFSTLTDKHNLSAPVSRNKLSLKMALQEKPKHVALKLFNYLLIVII